MRSKFEDRVRFNWGYHEGACNFGNRDEAWARNHFDKVYGIGFLAGMWDKAHGQYHENSDRAWAGQAS